jgi:hypothetical protein
MTSNAILPERKPMEDEITQLRLQLSWYANPENYRAKPGAPMTSHGAHRASPVERDGGDRARAALTPITR